MAAPVLANLRGSVDWPINGTIEFYQGPMVRPYAWNPVITDYLNKINRDTYEGVFPPILIETFNFRAGRVAPTIPYAKQIAFTSTPTLFQAGQIHGMSVGLPAVGSLTEFGVWTASSRDPAEFYVSSFSQVTSGHVGAAWTRPNVIFGVGRGRAPFTRAAYVAVGAFFTSVPSATKQYIKKVQLEIAPDDGGSYPTAYSKARQVQTVIHPDRLNYSLNPRFGTNTTSWSASAGGTLTRVALGSGWQGQIAITSNSSVTIGHALTNLVIGRRYIASVSVVADGRPNVLVSMTGGTVVAKQEYANSEVDPVLGGGFRRMYVIFDATATSATVNLAPAAVVATPNVFVTNMLVEQGDKLKPFFDGASGSDYLWEIGGTVNNTRSYYYKNRAERLAAVKRILTENVPMGIGIADPQFAVLPVE